MKMVLLGETKARLLSRQAVISKEVREALDLRPRQEVTVLRYLAVLS